MKDTNNILEFNELKNRLEGLDDEQRMDILADFIKEHENEEDGGCYNDIYKYTQFLDKYEYKFELMKSFGDDESINKVKEYCPEDKIEMIAKIIEGHNENEKLHLIIDFVREYEKKEYIRAYYDRGASPSYIRYTNIDKYIKLLKSYDDKLELAQTTDNFDIAEKILVEYPFNNEERNKYERLLENNDDIATVLNPKILSKKYDFLEDKLDFIVTDKFVTRNLLNLSGVELELFKLLYSKAEKSNAEILHTLNYMPYWIKNCSELTSSIAGKLIKNEKISDEIIEKLLWVYTTDQNEVYSIKDDIINNLTTIDDIVNLEKIIKETCENTINEESQKNDKDINKIKEALIMSTYGIGLDKAQSLLQSYNISQIELNDENKQTMLMYLAISQICNENNSDKLITIYNEYTRDNDININYLRDVVFQNELRAIFAKELNNVYTDIDDLKKVDEQEGVIIYDAGTDFKICMTAIGAYQGEFKNQENYFDYWNNKKILSHVNCCSLISNNNLTSATISNICLGFSGFDEDMLIGGSNKDMNSTDGSEQMYGVQYWLSNLSSPENIINSTRGQYNEIDYERRDLGNGEYYKKNPDFIVFFEEFDNVDNIDMNDAEIQEILNDEQNKWKESVKAAKEFNIPIVKINRERCAKSEKQKIENNFKKYLETHDVTLLSSIITNFENNRTGTREHNYLKEKYFSNEKIQEMLDKIFISLQGLQDDKLKKSNAKELAKLLENEKGNTERCNLIVRDKVTNEFLGFDVNKYLDTISQLIENEKER